MRLLVHCAAIAGIAMLANAQTAPAPKPAPETQKLNALAGTLNCEGVVKSTGAKSTGEMQCRWLKGDFVLECRARTTAPTAAEGVYVYGYSSAEKSYTLYSYGDNGASPSVFKGRVTDSTWSFQREGTYTGKPAKYQLVMTEQPGKITYQWRRTVEGGPWTVSSEGVCSKAN